MASARSSHTATLLPSGRVLVIGGDGDANDSMELYDPTTNTWSTAGKLEHGRSYHTAILLQSGKVLVAGGDAGASVAPAELVWFSTLDADPSAVAFPSTDRGSASPATTVALRSTGDTPWIVSTVRLAGADPDQFRLLTETCSGVRLEPGQSCTVSARFSPGVAAAFTATIVVSSDGSGPDRVIALTGTGTEPSGGGGGGGGGTGPPTTVTVDRAAFRVTWRKGVPSGSIRVAGSTAAAASLTFTLRRLTSAGTKAVKGWSFDQTAAGSFARTLALPRTLLPGRYLLERRHPLQPRWDGAARQPHPHAEGTARRDPQGRLRVGDEGRGARDAPDGPTHGGLGDVRLRRAADPRPDQRRLELSRPSQARRRRRNGSASRGARPSTRTWRRPGPAARPLHGDPLRRQRGLRRISVRIG